MHSILNLFYIFIIIVLSNFSLSISAVTNLDTHDYDQYGIRFASNDYFVVLAQNDGARYMISMAPFGLEYSCSYFYKRPNDFLLNVAVGRKQNSSQLSFVYLRTSSTDDTSLILGLYTFSRTNTSNSLDTTCNRRLSMGEGDHDVPGWKGQRSEMSTLQVDPDGKYAYGFLSSNIFIYDIANSFVQDLTWNKTFPSITVTPIALDIGKTSDNISVAIMVGYYQFDIEKTLPALYLVRLNPPYNMTLMDNYTFYSDTQVFIQGRDAFTYSFDNVMSVSIHDATQQVLVGIPPFEKTYLFSFNSTNLTYIKSLNHPARSTVWLDDNGTQAGLLLSDVATLPWSQSRVNVVNLTSTEILYVYPNNQQTVKQYSKTSPTIIRLTKTYDNQFVGLTGNGAMALVASADAGYYRTTDDINNGRANSQPCPAGTYKSSRSIAPCIVCPTMTKSSSNINTPFNSSNDMYTDYPTINCTACLSDSFCPLGSINDVNKSSLLFLTQAYAYPGSPQSTSFDDILIQNTFNLQSSPRRCLVISPFFWALITLCIAFIILMVMGILYYSPTGVKYFHRLEWFFRHSDLIGNGELWFGGLISFSIVVLVIYGFWFGHVFLNKYPAETSSDANFACDTTLRNAQFSSSLQLLTTIKTAEEQPIFKMLNAQAFTMTVSFIQTGYTCSVITEQENIGSYSVSLPRGNCTVEPDRTKVTVTYPIPYHKIAIQLNLTGSYYIGGVYICLTGPRSVSNDSLYTVQELKYCELFSTSDQTLGQTVDIYFALTKVINQTESLDSDGVTNYSGIWIPTTTHGALDDHLAYVQRGSYLRYLSTQHTIFITFSETEFYVSNRQEPISRKSEILFHNILFTTTVIGIFALAFLIFKLTFMPIIKWIIRRELFLIQFCKNRKGKSTGSDSTF